MMKRLLYIISALAFLATGCEREIESDILVENDQESIVLDLRPLEIQTRAGKDGIKDGVAEYNENVVSNAHIFFYANNANDDAPALKSLYVSSVPATRKVSLATSAAEIRALFGGTNEGRRCKVYVVANYNGSTAINHDRVPKYSRNELKELELATATWASLGQDTDDHRFSSGDTPNFVMSGEAELTSRGATAAPVVDGEVEISRVASKVTFSLTVADEIDVYIYSVDYRGNRIKEVDDEGNWTGDYKKELVTMKPNKTAMMVNLCFANKYAKLSGESYSPTGTTDPHFFDYLYRPFDLSSSVYTAQPFYSYPQKWEAGEAYQPYLKLVIPWTPYKEGGVVGNTKNYYYKIPLPGGELKRNNWYQIGLDVSILGGEEQEPIPVEINYCVAPWVAGAESDATVVTARYLSVPRKEYTLYNIEDLSIPMLSSHPCEIVNVSVTKPRYGSSTYSNTNVNFTNASLNEDEKLEIGSLNEVDLKHTLNNEMGRSLDCAPYTITFRIQQIDNPDYHADITIVQYPAIYIEKSTGGNAFVDGYYTLVTGGKPENNASNRTSGGVTYYYHGGSFNPNNDGTRITPYGNLNGGTASSATIPTSETENTKIHVTAFTSTSNTYSYAGETKQYIIGDPRIPFKSAPQITDKTITNYLTPGGSNNGTTAWTQAQLDALMVGTSVDNIIAPAFMFASEWGRQGTGESSFQTVAKRCATYQERGYPAGRWRLPTEAEVAFCANLQANGFIGTLFASGRYWISNGTAVSVSGANVTPQASGNSTRCVYDIWYWGEDPVVDPDYQYAVMP